MAKKKPVRCEKCNAEMNHHAEKLIYDEVSGKESVEEVHTCPKCGSTHTQKAE